MHRRLTATLAGVALLALLSGCALPLPIPKGPVEVPEPVPADAAVEVGSCYAAMTVRALDPDDRVSCGAAHYVDIIGFVEWPEMESVLAEGNARQVWEELSGYYGIAGDAHRYDLWTRDACGDAMRELLGWDGMQVSGVAAHDLRLLPGGNFTVESVLADSAGFRGGDHRVRCVVSWFDPVTYPRSDLTIASLFDRDFPARARDCYTADDEGYLDITPCDRPHTDQTMLTFDALGLFDEDFVLRAADLDDDAFAQASRFCEAAVRVAYGSWNADDYFAWGTSYGSDDWTVLRDDVDPEGYYPFGCLLSTTAGVTIDDLVEGAGGVGA